MAFDESEFAHLGPDPEEARLAIFEKPRSALAYCGGVGSDTCEAGATDFVFIRFNPILLELAIRLHPRANGDELDS